MKKIIEIKKELPVQKSFLQPEFYKKPLFIISSVAAVLLIGVALLLFQVKNFKVFCFKEKEVI